MPRIIKSAKLGDVAILKEIINILKVEKIRVISSLFFNPELTLKKGIYSKTKPNNEDKKDNKKAILTLNKISKYNFSQGAVARNNKVIEVEGKSGTEKMLKNCKTIKNSRSGVLVKFPKKKQDLRIDLPTIGLKTLIHSVPMSLWNTLKMMWHEEDWNNYQNNFFQALQKIHEDGLVNNLTIRRKGKSVKENLDS